MLLQKELPDAAKKTLREAIQIASEHQVPIAWTSANYFWLGCKQEEDALKISEVKTVGPKINLIIAVNGVSNTVTEAQSIREAVIEYNIEPRSKTIVVIADLLHSRSALRVWKKVFPESTILIKNVNGQWNEKHPAFFQRSELRWFLINIVRHLALIILGTKIVSLLHHPIAKKSA